MEIILPENYIPSIAPRRSSFVDGLIILLRLNAAVAASTFKLLYGRAAYDVYVMRMPYSSSGLAVISIGDGPEGRVRGGRVSSAISGESTTRAMSKCFTCIRYPVTNALTDLQRHKAYRIA